MASRPLCSQPASSFDGCLLLQALNEALGRLSAAAFVRRETAQKILTIAKQELLRLVLQRSSSLPSLVIVSHLEVYRHCNIGAAAAAAEWSDNTWLFVLRDPLIGVLPSSSGSSSSSGAATAQRSRSMQLQAEQLLQELKRQQLQHEQGQQQQLLLDAEDEPP
ncbi:hypothetical protein, conserved, partial [Eimeria tenella]